MDRHLFHSYELRRTTSLTPTRYLFNRSLHLRLQSAKNWRIYEIHDRNAEVKIRIAVHIERNMAVSPLRAPFGFIEFYKKSSWMELVDFISLMELDLKSRGVKKIQLKSYPEVYDKNSALTERALKSLHYITRHELSSVIRVDQKSYEKKIKISERQKLRKAEKMFSFEKTSIDQLKDIYSFIETCREEKNHRLSMTFSELRKVVAAFPEDFLLYKVYDASGTAAAAIVIKVNEKILYTFYYAHSKKYDKVSPVVFLISGIYEESQRQGIEMIDLGTSMKGGKINRSLVHFKKSIGGQSYHKHTFEKVLV